jgi:hypothetical protein
VIVDLSAAIRSVILGTAAAGICGGAMGAILGRIAPDFFRSSIGDGGAPLGPGPDALAHADHDLSVQTGLALGAITGLVLGALGCSLLAAVKMWVDARRDPPPPRDGEVGP